MVKIPFLHSRQPKPAVCRQSGRKRSIADQHHQELDQFQAVLESYGATRIDERLAILDVFLSTEQHLTLTELERLVAETLPKTPDRAFLQETMDMFCQFGFAKKRKFESQEHLYEHHHVGHHHDHFICTRCGHIQEFHNPDLEHLQLSVAREIGFHPLQHKMEIYGLCSNCMESRDDTIPLLLAANGERVRIVRITGGRELQGRLLAMGLTVGTCLEVINNHAAGPFIVAINGSRTAIGAGIAEKILVAHSCFHHDHGQQ